MNTASKRPISASSRGGEHVVDAGVDGEALVLGRAVDERDHQGVDVDGGDVKAERGERQAEQIVVAHEEDLAARRHTLLHLQAARDAGLGGAIGLAERIEEALAARVRAAQQRDQLVTPGCVAGGGDRPQKAAAQIFEAGEHEWIDGIEPLVGEAFFLQPLKESGRLAVIGLADGEVGERVLLVRGHLAEEVRLQIPDLAELGVELDDRVGAVDEPAHPAS